MKLKYPYKQERKFFVATFIFLLAYGLLIAWIYLSDMFPEFTKLFLTLMIFSLFVFGEYHHRVVMYPLTYQLGRITGKIEIIEELKRKKK